MNWRLLWVIKIKLASAVEMLALLARNGRELPLTEAPFSHTQCHNKADLSYSSFECSHYGITIFSDMSKDGI
jgi:hypothetical protein